MVYKDTVSTGLSTTSSCLFILNSIKSAAIRDVTVAPKDIVIYYFPLLMIFSHSSSASSNSNLSLILYI